jgi:hypothetical protein
VPDREARTLLIVGLRGHGDPVDAGLGMGADALAVAERVASRVAGHYDVAMAGFPYVSGPRWRIRHHIRAGALALRAFLDGRPRDAHERLILIGQSQGAAVLHLALPGLGDRFAAAVLLADPLRVARGPCDDLATPHGGILANVLLGPLGGLGPAREVIPESMAARVRSFCLPGDPVCEADLAALRGRRRGDVHTSYRLNRESIADRAADFAAACLLTPVG